MNVLLYCGGGGRVKGGRRVKGGLGDAEGPKK